MVLHRVLFSLVDTFCEGYSTGEKNAVFLFVQKTVSNLPLLLRVPLLIILGAIQLGAVFFYGVLFSSLAFHKRRSFLQRWKHSGNEIASNGLRFFEAFTLLGLHSKSPLAPLRNFTALSQELGEKNLSTEFLVVGSGPGGAVVAEELAALGKDTIVLEEGREYREKDSIPFSPQEMAAKFRNGGVSVTLGTTIPFAEGKCLGGGSEINSGFYHRTPEAILNDWCDQFGLQEAQLKDLEPFFLENERALSVKKMPEEFIPLASFALAKGAESLGWRAEEIPRWLKYRNANAFQRNTMSETLLKTAFENGARIFTQARVHSLKRERDGWCALARNGEGKRVRIHTRKVFVCAGAVNTPAILLRSGIRKNVGTGFQLHPMIKVVACFGDRVTVNGSGVPPHQVTEFLPRFLFGCSVSSPEQLAAGLVGMDQLQREKILGDWQRSAIYYVQISPKGTGRVQSFKRINTSFVTYSMQQADYQSLREGLVLLCKMLFAGGARQIYPLFRKPVCLEDTNYKSEIEKIHKNEFQLTSMHLFSSCAIGENQLRTAASSWGEVWGAPGLYLADGSILPTCPGVNPQGTIMALARRNVQRVIRG